MLKKILLKELISRIKATNTNNLVHFLLSCDYRLQQQLYLLFHLRSAQLYDTTSRPPLNTNHNNNNTHYHTTTTLTTMSQKIAVTGDINGKLTEFFKKLSALQSKQNFAFAIVAGNLFAGNLSDSDTASAEEAEDLTKLIKGEIEVPVATYFTVGKRPLPDAVIEKLNSSDGELCPNLIALGRKGSVKTSDGFKVVAIGGSHCAGDAPKDPYAAKYSDKDALAAKGYNEADILVTSEWPAGIRDGSRIAFDKSAQPPTSEDLSELCTALKPRYHFSSSDFFWEREPFFHASDPPRPITRFLSLAPFGNTSKSKWIYAFNLEPSAEPPMQVPAEATASPFLMSRKRKALDTQQDSFNSMRFSNGHDSRPRGGGNKRRKAGPPDPGQCYFCLSNPQCEAHMIGSIATEAYLTTAKGPLPTLATFPDLGPAFPGHMLIIPVPHFATIASIDDPTVRTTVEAEMQKYRASLHAMLAARSKDDPSSPARLGAVTWEISRNSGVHTHWQFLPVPAEHIAKGLVEAAFAVEAENSSYPTKFATSAADIAAAQDGDYFKVMIWSEALPQGKEMVLPLDATFRFDLQFGRRVMGKLLGLQERTHWKDCGQSREEEVRDSEAFKEMFAPFDFNLQG